VLANAARWAAPQGRWTDVHLSPNAKTQPEPIRGAAGG
jgi:hypothetical protein